MNAIFLGPPGVGKGTIAKMVVDKMDLLQISTGDLLRAAVKEGTELGLKAKQFMDAGELVTDEIVIGLLKERLTKPDCEKGVILDGFPRTIPQAEALEAEGVAIDAVVNFTAPREVIIQRLSGRRTCKACGAIYHMTNMPPAKDGVCDKCGGELFQRDDDKPEAIENRLVVYEKQTAPLIGFYRERDMLSDVKADDTAELIYPRVEPVLNK